MAIEKPLPQNIDAEVAVLGSCQIDPAQLPAVMAWLKPSDFYREAHRAIFQSMVDLFGAGTMPDLTTTCDELARSGKLDDAGGVGYVASLSNQVPLSQNAEYYAQIVWRCSKLRGIIREASQGAALAYNDADPSAVLSVLMDRLARLEVDRAGGVAVRDFADVLDEMLVEVEATASGDVPPGVYTGLPAMDEHTTGFRPKEMVIIAGRPGTFKSTVGAAFAVAEALRQAQLRAQGKESGTVLWVSMEMSRTQQAKRVLAAHARLNTRAIRAAFRMPSGEVYRKDFERFRSAYHELRPRLRGVLKIVDAPVSLSQLRQLIMREVVDHNLKAVFIDQFDLLEPEEMGADRRQGELERLNAYARGLKVLAMTMGITVFVLVQLNRASVAEGRPGLHNLAGTDRLGRDADAVIMTHYPAQGDPSADEHKRSFLELNLVKMRDGEGGVLIPAKITPRYALVEPWHGGPETWPEDATRRLGAPRDEPEPRVDDFEPETVGAGYVQGGF